MKLDKIASNLTKITGDNQTTYFSYNTAIARSMSTQYGNVWIVSDYMFGKPSTTTAKHFKQITGHSYKELPKLIEAGGFMRGVIE